MATLRERLGEVPALLVTGDTGPELVEAVERSGLPLLHKPVSLGRLRQAMARALETREEPTGPAPQAQPQLHLVRP